ncbi:hypothetical protein ACLHZ2_17870 [Aeromonas media]|uniref:hypothetical protein n=1 Tax=Aeromonas media TaxID=651 RepID=UPI003CFFE6C8
MDKQEEGLLAALIKKYAKTTAVITIIYSIVMVGPEFIKNAEELTAITKEKMKMSYDWYMTDHYFTGTWTNEGDVVSPSHNDIIDLQINVFGNNVNGTIRSHNFTAKIINDVSSVLTDEKSKKKNTLSSENAEFILNQTTNFMVQGFKSGDELRCRVYSIIAGEEVNFAAIKITKEPNAQILVSVLEQNELVFGMPERLFKTNAVGM